jgi:hypothetical protein
VYLVAFFRVVYEWHGWATLSKTPAAVDDTDPGREELSAVRALLAESDSVWNETADLRNANGAWHVWLAGFRNHYAPGVVGLFRAIAAMLPGSYGVLYAHDDEASDGWDRWIMRRGGVHHVYDHDLSPHIGVVEDPEGAGGRRGLDV